MIFGSAGAAMEFVFLLGRYRKFTWRVIIVAALMGVVGLALGIALVYGDLAGFEDVALDFGISALGGGVAAFVVGKVLKKI
jgi:hypothetical protein